MWCLRKRIEATAPLNKNKLRRIWHTNTQTDLPPNANTNWNIRTHIIRFWTIWRINRPFRVVCWLVDHVERHTTGQDVHASVHTKHGSNQMLQHIAVPRFSLTFHAYNNPVTGASAPIVFGWAASYRPLAIVVHKLPLGIGFKGGFKRNIQMRHTA